MTGFDLDIQHLVQRSDQVVARRSHRHADTEYGKEPQCVDKRDCSHHPLPRSPLLLCLYQQSKQRMQLVAVDWLSDDPRSIAQNLAGAPGPKLRSHLLGIRLDPQQVLVESAELEGCRGVARQRKHDVAHFGCAAPGWATRQGRGARLLRASRHDMGCLEVSGGPKEEVWRKEQLPANCAEQPRQGKPAEPRVDGCYALEEEARRLHV